MGENNSLKNRTGKGGKSSLGWQEGLPVGCVTLTLSKALEVLGPLLDYNPRLTRDGFHERSKLPWRLNL